MNALFFDRQERRIFDSCKIESFKQKITADEDTLTVIGYDFSKLAKYVGFFNRRGKFVLYRIQNRQTNPLTRQITLYAESDLYELITENPIRDARPTNTTAGLALTQALIGTRFEVGVVVQTALNSTRWFYDNPYVALRDIESKWAVRASVRYEIVGARIARRYIDLEYAAPVWRGKRFEMGKDILNALLDEDERNIVTALIGRGKGEEVGDGYGRRISFSDVEWSIANGDPADKPAGQDWIENPAATALYGVCCTRPLYATVTFDDIEDPKELLRATWNTLLTACEPVLSGEMSAAVLENMGFPHEAAYFGDEVAFITDGFRTRSQIVGVEREYARDGADVFQFGALRASQSKQLSTLQRDLKKTDEKANTGVLIAQKNDGLLSGYIDTMKTHILSSGTKMYTDTLDGGLIYETADGKRAVKITGTGILIASEKTGTDWKWTLAIDGSGIVADTITTGVLNAAAVTILGTDRFYWDEANICAINPENTNQQIRFGLYDGKNYGIGYTQDGGQTWQNAIGFDGVSISATGFSKSYVQLSEPAFPGVGDRWTQTAPRTWQDLAQFTWDQLKDMTWDEAAGYPYPKTYVWDGETWVLESDMRASVESDGYGDRISKVETEVRQTASEISSMARAEDVEKEFDEMSSTIKQNAKNWTAEFNRIGLAGSQTGITRADETGIQVSHSNIGGRTSMNADGFRLYDVNGNVIGGLFNVNGSSVSAVQRLMNASRTSFYVEVAPGLYADEEDGLRFWFGNAVCGILTGIYDSDGDSKGSMRLSARDHLYISAQNKLHFSCDAIGSLDFSEIYNAVHRVHMSTLDPGGNDGDIWLEPVNPMDVS